MWCQISPYRREEAFYVALVTALKAMSTELETRHLLVHGRSCPERCYVALAQMESKT